MRWCHGKTTYTTTVNIKIKIYNALNMSNLNYCFLVWATTTSSNLNHLHTLQKKAVRQIAGVPYDAHTKELFIRFNFISMPKLYSYTLCTRYKQCLKNNEQILLALAELKTRTPLYATRNNEFWQVPFSRNRYGEQSVRYTLLNMFFQQGIDITDITKKGSSQLVCNKVMTSNLYDPLM